MSSADNPTVLGTREAEVLRSRSRGLSNQEIDDQLAVTVGTIKGHLVPLSLREFSLPLTTSAASFAVLSINSRQPYVIDDASGLKSAGALVAGFGYSSTALLDVLTGKVLATGAAVKPQGKLPYAPANNLQAVIDNQPDAPGYPPADTLYPFGFGLSY